MVTETALRIARHLVPPLGTGFRDLERWQRFHRMRVTVSESGQTKRLGDFLQPDQRPAEVDGTLAWGAEIFTGKKTQANRAE